MTIPTLKRVLGTAALALALGACKNDSTGSDDDQVGDVSFTYSGAQSGQFVASGEFDRNDTDQNEFGAAILEDGDVVLLAADGSRGSFTDVFLLAAPASVRTTTCTSATQLDDCPILGIFDLGYTSTTDLEPEAQYFGYVGNVQVTALTDDRVRGTFSLRMEDEGGANTVEVRSGSFDVPIIPSSAISANRSPLTAASVNRVLSRR